MNRVLLIAVLLRFMDSFMIYTEPFVVTGGGPGNSTTFVSIELVKIALGQFDLGKAAALSLVYNLIILIVCWVFYTVMTNAGAERPAEQGSRVMHSIPGRRIILSLFLIFLMLPIYWLVNMSFKTNSEIVTTMTLWPHQPTLANYKRIFTDESWYSGYINSLKYVVINTVISISFALPAAYAFSRYRFLGDKHLFFWLLSNRMAPAGGVTRCRSSISIRRSACSIRRGRSRWRIACSTCRWRSGSSKASSPACRARSTRPRFSTAIRSRASSSRS